MLIRNKNIYSKKDFNPSFLPHSRKDQFSNLFHNEKMTMFKIGLLLAVGLFPLLVILIFQNYDITFLMNKEICEEFSKEHQAQAILINNLAFNTLRIVALLFFAVIVSGIGRIMKNLFWNEGVFFTNDFKQGVKQNFPHNFFVFALVGILHLVLNLLFDLGYFSEIVLMQYAFWAALFLIILIIAPMFLFICSQNCFYKNKLSISFSNSVSLAFVKYIPNVLFSFGFVIFSLLLDSNYLLTFVFFNYYFIYIIVFVALVIFLLPYLISGWVLYSLSVFDAYLNTDYEDYLWRGLQSGKSLFEIMNKNKEDNESL